MFRWNDYWRLDYIMQMPYSKERGEEETQFSLEISTYDQFLLKAIRHIHQEIISGIQKLDKLLDQFIQSANRISAPKTLPKKQNFANYYGGAVILTQSSTLNQVENILVDSVEVYMITECSQKDVYFVICLKEEIQLETIYFINKELYSSTLKNFQVYGSVIYPTNEWELLGRFEAEDTNDWQYFQFESHFLRYLKIHIVDFHQAEFHCTLTQIRVQGQTVIGDLVDSYKRDKVFSPKIENDVRPATEATTSLKINFNELMVDDDRNNTCSFLDYFYHQPKIGNQFINVLPYESKQSLLKVTAQNILILSHNVQLIKQSIDELEKSQEETTDLIAAGQKQQQEIKTIQSQLLQQLQQQQLINQNLESQMQQIRFIIIIALFTLAILSILVTILCATRQPSHNMEQRLQNKSQSTIVRSQPLLLTPIDVGKEEFSTPIIKSQSEQNGKKKKKKTN